MSLTPLQHDALTEIVNIGFGKAAATLSVLTGKRVILNVPDIYVMPTNEVDSVLSSITQGEVTTINQVFMGKVSGNALLILNQASASILVDLITHGKGESRRLMASDREALLEIGNILLNAYVGSFGNILNVQIRFMVPKIQSENLGDLLDSISIAQVELNSTIVVKTQFVIGDGQISGYVLIVMGVESLDLLLAAIDAQSC